MNRNPTRFDYFQHNYQRNLQNRQNERGEGPGLRNGL